MRRRDVLLAVALLGVGCGGTAEETPITAIVDGEGPATIVPTTTPPSEPTAVPPAGDATAPPADPVWYGDHISVGDCFDDTYDDEGEWIYTDVPVFVDCDLIHDNEAYSVFTIEGTPYPGDDAFDDLGAEVCRADLAAFIDADPDQGGIDWWWGWPLEEEWEAGARRAFCALYLDDAHMVGSLQGVGTGFRPAELPEVAPVPQGAVYDRLDFSEDGDRVASFLMPSGTLDEAIEGALGAADEAGLTPVGMGRTGSVFVFRFDADGTTYSVTVYERSDGQIEWWLYFPPE